MLFICDQCSSFFDNDPSGSGPCLKCGSSKGYSPIGREKAIDMIAQKEHNPVSMLIPNGDQEKWIKLIGTHVPTKKPRTKVLSAPNKIGKSASTIAIMANIFWGRQSNWFDYPMYNEPWPFPKICWFASWESALKEILIPEMIKWFPKGRYTHSKKGKHFEYHWTTDTGWQIFIKSYDQGDVAFESALCGLVVFSEPPPESIYDAIPARLSMGGMILIEQTPVPKMNPAWLYDVLEEEGKAEFLYSELGLEVNCQKHGIRGLLKHSDIVEMIEGYSWQEKYARVTGKSMNLSGAVFKRFSEERHVVETRSLAQDEQIWMVCDPHDRKPPYITWWAINPGLDIRLVHEFPMYRDNKGYEKIAGTTLMIKDFCYAILKIEKQKGYSSRIINRIIDPYSGSRPYANTRYSVIDTYNLALQNGSKNPNEILFMLGTRQEVAYGEDLLMTHLDYELATEDRTGFKPKITFEKHCMNGIRAIRRYSHVDPAKIRDDMELAPGKKRTERWKHFIDNVRYLLGGNPYYDYDRAPKNVRKNQFWEVRNAFGQKEPVQTNWLTS